MNPSKIIFTLLALGLLVPLVIADQPVSPQIVEVTKVFSSLPYDNSLYGYGLAYSVAHDSLTGQLLTLTNWAVGGQWKSISEYYVWRTYPMWDTSTIPVGATIKSANISIYITSDNSTTDFNVTLQHGTLQIHPHEPVVSTDFCYAYYTGNGGSRNTSTIAGVGYWNITLNSDGLSWINKTGHTKLVLRSSRDIDNIAPTGAEYIIINTYEAGEAYSPKLYVSYEVQGYKYIIHGPYLESGTVYNGIVNVTVSYDGQEPYSFDLDGTGGNAETVNITSGYRGLLMNWNITSSYNHSRIIVFTLDGFDEAWLYVPASTDLIAEYSVTVSDLAGLTNATVETTRNILGYNRIVERQNLDVNNPMKFWLIMYQQYTLKVESDQGEFVWSLVADGLFDKNFVVTKDMVTLQDSSKNMTVTASRLNGTAANIYYNDPKLLTTSITTTIRIHNSSGYYLNYTQTDYGNTQNITVNNLDSAVNYQASISADQSGTILSWQFSLPVQAANANRWTGTWNNFTTDPAMRALLENGFGTFIVVMFIALGSWSDSEWFLGAAILIAGFLVYIGFLTVPYAGLSAGLMIVLFMYFHRGKAEMREL